MINSMSFVPWLAVSTIKIYPIPFMHIYPYCMPMFCRTNVFNITFFNKKLRKVCNCWANFSAPVYLNRMVSCWNMSIVCIDYNTIYHITMHRGAIYIYNIEFVLVCAITLNSIDDSNRFQLKKIHINNSFICFFLTFALSLYLCHWLILKRAQTLIQTNKRLAFFLDSMILSKALKKMHRNPTMKAKQFRNSLLFELKCLCILLVTRNSLSKAIHVNF